MMIWRFFGLKEAPFSITPDPDYLYLGQKHRQALNEMLMGVKETIGFVVITGEVGTGKTTLCRFLMRELEKSYEVVYLNQPILSPDELLKTVMDGIRGRYLKKDSIKNLLDKIKRKLEKLYASGKPCLLVIDEAQLLDSQSLEMIRLLTNFETDKTKLLQVMLIGQPELDLLLKRHEVRQVAQRITAHFHLAPLSSQEVKRYLEHRLATAGCEESIFTEAAAKLIHQSTGGLPRLINTLAERAMHVAFRERELQIGPRLVKKALSEWAWSARQEKKSIPSRAFFALGAVALIVFSALGWNYLKLPPQALIQSPIIRDVKLAELPHPLQRKLDSLAWGGHVFLDDPSFRQVVIGNRSYRIGDHISQGMVLEDITEEFATIRMGEYRVQRPWG